MLSELSALLSTVLSRLCYCGHLCNLVFSSWKSTGILFKNVPEMYWIFVNPPRNPPGKYGSNFGLRLYLCFDTVHAPVTRGHYFKLVPQHCKYDLRIILFLLIELSQYGTTYPMRW